MQLEVNKDKFYFANYHFLLELKELISHIEPQDLLEIKLNLLYSGVVGLDELWAWLESRGSGSSSNNRVLSHVAFQSGKSGFDIIWSAQLSSSVDKRIRLLTDYFYVTLTPSIDYFKYAYVSATKVVRFKLPRIKAANYYKYYDTQERIMPLEAGEIRSPRIKTKPDSNDVPDEDLVKEVQEIKFSQEDKELILTLKNEIQNEVTSHIMEQLQTLKDSMTTLTKQYQAVETRLIHIQNRKDKPKEEFKLPADVKIIKEIPSP